MAELEPAAILAAQASRTYPNDSAQYRAARTALLEEEIELRRHIQRVAAQRRALPPGGEIERDYELGDERGATVRFSDLFGPHDTLVTYFWMYGPERERPCPMCTSFLGSLDIPALDITRRVALAVIGRSPVERQFAFARERGWRTCASSPPATTSPGPIAASLRTATNGPRSTSGRRRTGSSATSGALRNRAGQPIPARIRTSRPIRRLCGTSSI